MGTSGWRALILATLLLLPVWAALDGTHRTAHLPSLEDAQAEWLAAHESGAPAWAEELAALLAAETMAGLLTDHRTSAHGPAAAPAAAATPFPPLVARWRALVEAELHALRATRGLSETITPELVLAVIAAESGGDPDARSHAHAAGLMQVLPTTLASLVTETPTPNPFDPTTNVRAGILYLDQAVRTHRDSLEWALAAYNAGIPSTLRARSAGDAPFSESSAFAGRVLAALRTGG